MTKLMFIPINSSAAFHGVKQFFLSLVIKRQVIMPTKSRLRDTTMIFLVYIKL